MPTAVAGYPDYKDQVERLVDQHRKRQNGRLHLAVYLAPPNRSRRDVCLFEVLDDFGGGRIDPDKKLFTFAYGSTPGFPLPLGARLWMILTNPPELERAIAENWKRLGAVRKAQRAGNAIVIYADAKGRKFWKSINEPSASLDGAGGIRLSRSTTGPQRLRRLTRCKSISN